jgi:ATP-dependent Lon protease
MNHPERIPIFPLNVVLFPGMRLPLHIFEARYKQMIHRCMSEAISFGVILAGERGMATVGTTAEVIHKVRAYPDGRMDILTTGRAVFSVKEIFDTEAYHQAQVEYLRDPLQPLDAFGEAELVEAFQRCQTLLYGQSWSPTSDAGAIPLSYRLASRLPLDLAEKQRLLETRGEKDRRALLRSLLAQLLPQIAESHRIRRSAGGNGHPPR